MRHDNRVVTNPQDFWRITLVHQLNHDALTGLPNRNGFIAHMDARLGESVASTVAQTLAQAPEQRGHAVTTGRDSQNASPSLALLCVDVDGTRSVNSRFGREAGDAVLAEVARRLAKVVPEKAVVARLVDDEFGVLANGIDEAGAHDMTVRLRNEITQPMQYRGQGIRVGATVSITWPQPGMTADAVLKTAALQLEYARKAAST
ncbi:GGDEF domain-containing protein [Streptomyces sp. NPDC001480]|uniref:GGDEF domain-containing protein n=1 Tax=Streptomyces sp. NPDC001480 TaxID=3364577 RepID=UPI00367EA692